MEAINFLAYMRESKSNQSKLFLAGLKIIIFSISEADLVFLAFLSFLLKIIFRLRNIYNAKRP